MLILKANMQVIVLKSVWGPGSGLSQSFPVTYEGASEGAGSRDGWPLPLYKKCHSSSASLSGARLLRSGRMDLLIAGPDR